jgi:hypothetical protein
MGGAVVGRIIRQLQPLVVLVCVSSGCWEFHRLPTDTDAATSGACTGESCGAAGGGGADPFQQPLTCSMRKPSTNPGEKLCKAGTLEVNCVNAPPKIPCPATFRDGVRLACEQGGGKYVAFCNACGGTTVRVPDRNYSFEMHYDASDRLVGVTLLLENPVGPCEQREFVFSEHCSAANPAGAEMVLSCESLPLDSTQLAR